MKKIISILLLCLAANNVWTCDCKSNGLSIYGVFNKDIVNHFDWIFLAKIKAPLGSEYKFEIIETFKGSISKNIKIINTTNHCNRDVENGETYLIYCNKVSNDSLILDACTRHREIYKERYNIPPPPAGATETQKLEYEKSTKGDSMLELEELRKLK